MKDFLSRINILVPLLLSFVTDRLVAKMLTVVKPEVVEGYGSLPDVLGGIPTDLVAAGVVLLLTMFADFLPEPLKSWVTSLVQLFQKPAEPLPETELKVEDKKTSKKATTGQHHVTSYNAIRHLKGRAEAANKPELVEQLRKFSAELGSEEYDELFDVEAAK